MSAAIRKKSSYVTIVSDLHRVGGGYSVRFITQHTDDGYPFISCEWTPTMPSARDLRRKVDMQRYGYALAQFVQAVTDALVGQAGAAP